MDNKAILSTTVPVEEPPADDLTQFEVSEKSIIAFETSEILDHIGKSDFKTIWLNFSSEIKSQELNVQKDICRQFLFRLQEVYDFIFPEKVIVVDEDDVSKSYKLLEFIEYECFDFLVELCSSINMDFKDVDLYMSKSNEIVKQVDHMIDILLIPEMMTNILMTLDEKSLVKFLGRIIIRDKSRIVLELKIRSLTNDEQSE